MDETPESGTSAPEMDETCKRVQLAIIHSDTLAPEVRAHLAGCTECGFLADLSRNLPEAEGTPASEETTALGSAFAAALAHVLAGSEPLLGRYRLDALRGRGGQGHVYRATDLETDETVAVKLVRVAGRDTGVGEVANARRIRHENVCRVYHTERFGGIRLIVMEYVEGPSLTDELSRLDRAASLAVFRGVCAGVAAAHDADVLHLDLKPGNVLLRDGQPVVTDFGLSRRSGAGATAAGGTPRYMAPEQQRRGPVDRRTDVFALGRMLEALVPDAPRRLRRIAARAAAAEPGDRYADARTLLRALDPPRRPWVRWAIAAPAVVAVTLGILYLAIPPPRGPRASWYPAVFGEDPIPAEAWNVARNLTDDGPPRVEVEGRMFGCGQQPWELLDGIAQYVSWEHGVAWLPVPLIEEPEWMCNLISRMGSCGTLSPSARLCERIGPRPGEFRILDVLARDLATLPPAVRARAGEAIPREPCQERALVVHLGRTYPVFAVRAWHHGRKHTPRHYRIEAAQGRLLFEAHDSEQARTHEAHYPLGGNPEARMAGAQSAPVTAIFAPSVTDRVRLVIDTCSTLTDEELALYRERGSPNEGLPEHPGHGWLYEVEVFARIPRHEAWWRHLTED